MTDDDKALVDRLRWVSEWFFVDPVDGAPYASDDPLDAADRIEALSAENERLREILREVTPPVHFGESEQNKAWWAKARAALGETK